MVVHWETHLRKFNVLCVSDALICGACIVTTVLHVFLGLARRSIRTEEDRKPAPASQSHEIYEPCGQPSSAPTPSYLYCEHGPQDARNGQSIDSRVWSTTTGTATRTPATHILKFLKTKNDSKHAIASVNNKSI